MLFCFFAFQFFYLVVFLSLHSSHSAMQTWKTKKGKEQQKLKHVQAGAKQQIRPCGGDVVITY